MFLLTLDLITINTIEITLDVNKGVKQTNTKQTLLKHSCRSFEEKTLGQIKTVYPEAYIYRQEKGIPIPGTGEINSWQLTIAPNLGDGKEPGKFSFQFFFLFKYQKGKC